MWMHKAEPVKGSWIRASDGASADLFRLDDYPLTGICSTCEQPITVPTFLADWTHFERE